jgi:hypothetical protein
LWQEISIYENDAIEVNDYKVMIVKWFDGLTRLIMIKQINSSCMSVQVELTYKKQNADVLHRESRNIRAIKQVMPSESLIAAQSVP